MLQALALSGRFVRRVLGALVLCTAAAAVAWPGVAAALPSPTLAIERVSYATRSITFVSAYATDTAKISLFVNGVEETSTPVASDADGIARLVADLPGDCTVEAVARTQDGSDAATSTALSVRASQYAPASPALRLLTNHLVRPSYIFTLLSDGRATSAKLRIDGVVKWAGTVSANTTVRLPAVAVPYGRHAASVTVANAWGGRTSISTPIYQLGWSLPAKWRYVLIDKSDFYLYYVTGQRVSARYPVSIGMPYMPTPTGTFVLGAPERSPSSVWGVLRMPLRKKIGRYWLRTGLYVHGTNDPDSIGTMSSHGCVRMYNRDVQKLAGLLQPYARPITRIRD